MKITSNIWRYVFFVFVIFLLYQLHSSWDDSSDFNNRSNHVSKDDVLFLTIDEYHYGTNSRGFDSLMNSLRTWEHDEKNDKVKFKFDSYLPKDNTKALFVYNTELSTFEKYVDVVPVSTLPYEYNFQNSPLLQISHIDKDGDIYFVFKGKKIHLKQGETYQNFGISDFRLSRIKIKNHGFYKKDNFSLMNPPKEEKESEKKSKAKS